MAEFCYHANQNIKKRLFIAVWSFMMQPIRFYILPLNTFYL